MTFLPASENAHKAREFAAILAGHQVVLPGKLGLRASYEETSTTFLGNALGKAEALFRRASEAGLMRSSGGLQSPTGMVVDAILADDSGLCVEALDGRPGVYTARYGGDGSGKLTASERNQHLLRELADASNRSAYYVCCAVAYLDVDRFFVVQETWHGEIAREASDASGGFGYDPVFYLADRGCTVAEIGDAEKHRLSHRGKALRRLLAAIENGGGPT